jgi:hypothetical protein
MCESFAFATVTAKLASTNKGTEDRGEQGEGERRRQKDMVREKREGGQTLVFWPKGGEATLALSPIGSKSA